MARAPVPTSHDVARIAGVSQPTVSRALRGDPRLSPATRRRVQQAARDLAYVPSQRGRSLATRSTGQIGIVVSDLGNPFYLQVLDALHEALRRSDRRLLVLTADPDGRIPLDRLVDGSLDGVVLTSTPLHSTLPAELGRRGFPFVLLNREVDDAPGDVCVVDNAAGARLVAEELLNLGHRAIAAVFGPEYSSTGRDREASFRRVLDAAGVALPAQRWRRARYHFAEGHRCAVELLGSEPTALWCANDILALGAYNAIHAQGLRIPQDITLIGFDDLTLAGWEMFELTTVSQDIERMVKTGTELLLSRIAHNSDVPLPPRRAVLPAALVRRRTHGRPPVVTRRRPAPAQPADRGA